MKEQDKKGFITDFDNTLVKTREFIVRHIKHTCKRLEVDSPQKTKIIDILKTNPPFEEIFSHLFGDKSKQFLDSYRQDAMETYYEAADGALELIKTLKDKNIKIVIVSNRINKLDERLRQANFNPKDFIAIIQPQIPKPSKKAYAEAIEILEKANVNRKNIVILGDSPDDYAACPDDLTQNFFAVTTGPNTSEDFLILGLSQDHILMSTRELIGRIENF